MANQFTTKEGKQKYLEKRVGQRFGRLIVLKRVGTDKHGNTLWKCKCDCGNIAIVSMGALTKGHTKSCGCLSKERLMDLRGKRFGKWIVLNKPHISTSKGAFWRCKCDCGKIKEVCSNDLRKGISKSCGCANTLPKGESGFNRTFNHVRKQAINRGYSFNLTKNEAKTLFLQNCAYCGSNPSCLVDSSKNRSNGDFNYNTIDRIDNSKGYTKGNVQTLCYDCNRMKGTLSEKEFKNHLKRIIYFKKSNIGLSKK